MTRLPLVLAGLLVVGTVSAGRQSTPPAIPPAGLPAHDVATGLKGGYQELPVDVNRDGRVELVSVATAMPDFVWFENPGRQRRVIATGITARIYAAAAGLDGPTANGPRRCSTVAAWRPPDARWQIATPTADATSCASAPRRRISGGTKEDESRWSTRRAALPVTGSQRRGA
jgi:hypothetical protein